MSDLTKCPECGGEADNGHDRCVPPNAYFCTKCEQGDTPTPEKSVEEIVEEIDLQNVDSNSIHAGLHNACNHLFFADTEEEHREARKEIQEEVRSIVKHFLQTERQKREEEVVEKVWEIVNVRPVTPEGAISKAHLVAELEALTQPNNK